MDFSNEEKPVSVSINTKIAELQPANVFFFKRADGTTFFTDEKTAWDTYKGRKFTYIGFSSGKTYNTALKESQMLFKTKGLKEAQEVLRTAVELELEEAKKNPVPPVNNDVFGDRKSVDTFKTTMRL